jgi:hypothetical protein
MANLICMGAALQCSFGAAPSVLVVPPANRVMTGPASATIMDNSPGAKVPPFVMCTAPANPTVIAATAAALGTPTPGACVPVLAAPWAPGAPTVMIGGMPALDASSQLMCAYGGVIKITAPGEFTVQVP